MYPIQDGRFRQLSQLLQRSPLVNQLLQGGVTYTLLAPNDEAFQKIPISLRQRLLTNHAATEGNTVNTHFEEYYSCFGYET